MAEWWSYVGGRDFFPVDVTGSRTGPMFPSAATRQVEADEPVTFDSLAAMAAASEVVVRAVVVAVGPGPAAEPDGGPAFRLRSVTVKPREIVKGAPATDLVRFAEPGYTSDGVGFTLNGVAWSRVGDEGWFFLVGSDDSWMRLVSSYGRLLEDGPSGLAPASRGPWRGQPVGDPEAIESVVRAAVS
jgi:hypothetical protein